MKRFILIILLLSISIRSQTKRDPRVVAMAGSYTTIANGIFSVGYNPGLIGLQQNKPMMIQGFQLDFGLVGNFFSIENIANYSGDTLDIKEKNALLILGAGNQTDTAFSPKTLSILDKSGKSAIVVRNHRFSEVHARSFANLIMPKIIQVKFIYQIYVNIMQKIYSMKSKSQNQRYDDDHFSA